MSGDYKLQSLHSLQTKIVPSSLARLQEEIRVLPTDLVLIISDEVVWNLYAEKIFGEDPLLLQNRAQEGGWTLGEKKILLWVGPAGEKIKSLSFYEKCLETLLAQGIHRQAHVLALGGGAVSDFAGFVAATHLRGLPLSIIPTTLLSMVDACLGGKVGLNSRHGKNLIGAFHFPQSLYLCEEFLLTLSPREIKCGKGEILKYAFLDSSLSALLENQEKEGGALDLGKLIQGCLEFKQKIVREDPWEENLRRILNLGHTIGHALEKMFPISHGEAVLIGIFGILHYFIPRENFQVKEKFSLYLKALGLSCEDLEVWQFLPSRKSFDEFFALIGKDKKKLSNQSMVLVLVEQVGHPYLKEFSMSELRERLSDFWMELHQFVRKRR